MRNKISKIVNTLLKTLMVVNMIGIENCQKSRAGNSEHMSLMDILSHADDSKSSAEATTLLTITKSGVRMKVY